MAVLTLRALEAVAPLVVGQFPILEGVARVEQRLHALLWQRHTVSLGSVVLLEL